jgi:hypothetical protein
VEKEQGVHLMDVLSLPVLSILALLVLGIMLLVVSRAISRGTGITRPLRAAPMERRHHDRQL